MSTPHRREDDCICASCELTFALPVLAICPYCSSRQVRRLTDEDRHKRLGSDVERVRAAITFHRSRGDYELADAYASLLGLLEDPQRGVMSEAFVALAPRGRA